MENEGINVNAKDSKYGSTPLDLAAAYNTTVDVVKYMIEDKKCYSPPKLHGFNTPLHSAAYQGNLSVVRYLVENIGLNVKVRV